MEYNSFYGGRKGASFIIVKTYPDVISMCTDFAQGGDFKGVGYDEYVMINTVNKNHPDNGKIFRRGYDYNSERTIECYRVYDNDTHQEIINGTEQQYLNCYYRIVEDYPAGGAEYVGTVVGPAGEAPTLIMTTYSDAQSKQGTEGFQTQKSHGEYAPTTDLIPGKTDDGNGNITYNDNIQWYCTSIRASNGEDTLAYIGFIIPYPVIEYSAASVSPYYHRSSQTASFSNENLIVRNDDGTHPFYEHWNVSIPKGIKGDTFRDFRVVIPNSDSQILDWSTGQQYTGFNDDVSGGRKILIYTYYHYDAQEQGEPINYYIGDYNMIDSFTLDEDGSVHVRYTHKTEGEDYPYLLKWITNIQFNVDSEGETDTGHVIITYNTKRTDGINADTDEYDLDWIQGMSIDNDGTVHYHHTTRTDDDKQDELLNWITNVALVTDQSSLSQISTDEGKLTITFNNENLFEGEFTAYLKWVNGISLLENGELQLHFSGGGQDVIINEDDPIRYIKSIIIDTTQGGANQGKLTVTYNTDLVQSGVDDTYEASLKWVNGISLSNDGNLTLHYSGGGQDQVITTAQNHLKWVDDIELSAAGVITVTYNDNTTTVLDETLKWISSIDMSAAGVVTVTYNDGTHEDLDENIKWISSTQVSSDGDFIIHYNDNTSQTFEELIQWVASATVANDGTLTFTANNGDTIYVGQKLIKWINSVSVNPTTQRLEILYNNSSEKVAISQALNYIDEMVMPNTGAYKGHVLVYYTDPSKRGNITYDNRTGWQDIGDLTYVNTELSDMAGDIAVLSSRMDGFTNLAEGSTTGDAELADIRVAADGTTYANAGTAVRTQVNNLNQQIEQLKEHLEEIAYGAYITESVNDDNGFTILDGANAIPVKNLEIDIAITQNGSGTPSSSNIRPIVSRTGINLTHNLENIQFSFASLTPNYIFAGKYNVVTGVLTKTYETIPIYHGQPIPGVWVSSQDVYQEGTLPTVGAQVIYELETPETYQLTPMALKTTLGSNYFEANTGNIDLQYRADTMLYIQQNS